MTLLFFQSYKTKSHVSFLQNERSYKSHPSGFYQFWPSYLTGTYWQFCTILFIYYSTVVDNLVHIYCIFVYLMIQYIVCLCIEHLIKLTLSIQLACSTTKSIVMVIIVRILNRSHSYSYVKNTRTPSILLHVILTHREWFFKIVHPFLNTKGNNNLQLAVILLWKFGDVDADVYLTPHP